MENLWGTLTDEMKLVQNYKKDFEKINKEIKNIQNQSSDIVEVFNDLKSQQTDLKGIKRNLINFLSFMLPLRIDIKNLQKLMMKFRFIKLSLRKSGRNK